MSLDASAVMFALAYERGLFVGTLGELLSSDNKNRYFKTHPEVPMVAKQAVLVSADSKGNIIPNKDMGYSGLKRKLKETCEEVGLLEYFIVYAFQRCLGVELHGCELYGCE